MLASKRAPLTKVVGVRVSPDEYELLAHRAEQHRVSVPEYLRLCAQAQELWDCRDGVRTLVEAS